jgi:hypothetical protein
MKRKTNPRQTQMNYPTEIYADTDLVCSEEPKEGSVKYIRADNVQANDLALRQWMQEVTWLLCYQTEVPHGHKDSVTKSLDRFIATLPNIPLVAPRRLL